MVSDSARRVSQETSIKKNISSRNNVLFFSFIFSEYIVFGVKKGPKTYDETEFFSSFFLVKSSPGMFQEEVC